MGDVHEDLTNPVKSRSAVLFVQFYVGSGDANKSLAFARGWFTISRVSQTERRAIGAGGLKAAFLVQHRCRPEGVKPLVLREDL